MSVLLELTPRDSLVARDGRPFGVDQGQRMRGLPWLLPSVVAGSFRTALVKAGGLDFSGDIPERLLQIEVAGVFPVHEGRLYLPAPNDAVAQPTEDGKEIEAVHRVTPQELNGGCDFPDDLPLRPVMLSGEQAATDFKPADIPTWWPVERLTRWLNRESVKFDKTFFDKTFLRGPRQEQRDHVCLDANRGAAAESLIFATAGLNLTHLPRFGVTRNGGQRSFADRFAEIKLSARATIPKSETVLKLDSSFDVWHPLGGERRLVHWRRQEDQDPWACPELVRQSLAGAKRIRLVLATPAVFQSGWKPGWLKDGLEGSPPGASIKLRLVGVSIGRWKAVSGWSLAPPRGPKPIRRMVPAGGVYFFEVAEGEPTELANCWLQSVSDKEHERRDGFGLAVWGAW